MSQTATFNEVLELIDQLTLAEREDLLNIVRHRTVEERRDEIAQNIIQSKQEYAKGNVFRGGIDEVLAELDL